MNGLLFFSMTSIAAGNVEDPECVSDALDKIRHSSDHLLTLINDILDLNRIESGKMTIAHDPTDIRAAIDQCTEVLKGSVINRDLKIITDTERIEYPFVLTDALHIRQILINIISNAVKFTPDGGSITFRAEGRRDETGDTLLCRFEVADTGIGMNRMSGLQLAVLLHRRFPNMLFSFVVDGAADCTEELRALADGFIFRPIHRKSCVFAASEEPDKS